MKYSDWILRLEILDRSKIYVITNQKFDLFFITLSIKVLVGHWVT